MIHSSNNYDYLNGEPATFHHPCDDIEPRISPADEVRHARVECVRLLNAFGNRIESALSEPSASVKSIATQFWAVAYALGLNCTEGMSMTDRAIALGVVRASISKGARNFVESNGLEPSWHMKSEASIDSYRETRIQVVIASANGNGSNGTNE
jgi:hypothetical protein